MSLSTSANFDLIGDFQNLSIDNDMDIIESVMNDLKKNIVKILKTEITTTRDLLRPYTDHDIESQASLKLAHHYCIINQIPAQPSGNLIERYMIHHYQMVRNKASLNIGDARLNGIDYEIKASFGGQDRNKFNYVQIRMNHNCAYLLTAYYLCKKNAHLFGTLYVFRLNKSQMIHMLSKYGTYAHGTIKKLGSITIESITKPGNDKEYALRVTYASARWNDLLQFSISPMDI